MTLYIKPNTLKDALNYYHENPHFEIIAGGTDKMLDTENKPIPQGIIDIFDLKELKHIELLDDIISIGSATTYSTLLKSSLIHNKLPLLYHAFDEIGAMQIQARGTIGGNIGTSSPVGDTLPPLLVLDATIELTSKTRIREIPYHSFCTGYRKTACADNEIITCIKIPVPKNNFRYFWKKVGTRKAQAISKVMIAGSVYIEQKEISSCRLALGAVADRPIRLKNVEKLICQEPLDKHLPIKVKIEIEKTIKPMDDLRSNAEYRSFVAGNLGARFIKSLY